MKTSRRLTIFKALVIPVLMVLSLLPGSVRVSSSNRLAPEPRTIVVTLLGGQQQRGRMEVTLSIDGAKVEASTAEVPKDVPAANRQPGATTGRERKLQLIDNEHPAEVACATNEAECGSVDLADGGKIAACVCKETAPAQGSRIPVAVRAKLIGPVNGAAGDPLCWDDKDRSLSICYRAGTTLSAAPKPHTREHILLAKTNY